MVKVLYPGSFDPVHNSHIEICATASRLFDHVVVAAMRNPQKSSPFFTDEERVEMLTDACEHLGNVEVVQFGELVVDLARRLEVDFIIKGLRGSADFESELQMAQMNAAISGVQTLFLPTATRRSFLASRLIREVVRLGGDVSDMVPEPVRLRVEGRLGSGAQND